MGNPVPPGWYPDPWAPRGGLRWWGGSAWGAPAAPPTPVVTRPLADPWPRLAARILDGLLLAVVIIPLELLLLVGAIIAGSALTGGDGGTADEAGLLIAVGALFLFLAFLVVSWGVVLTYNTLMLRRDGQTLGKKVLGIRVVTLEGGRPPDGREALVREAVYLALGYIDALWCLWDKPWRQCLHDKAVRTIVVPA